MKVASIGRRERRSLVVGSLLAVAVLIPVRIWPMLRALQESTRAAALEKHAQAAQATLEAREIGVVTDSLRARRERFLDLAPWLTAGTSLPRASAELAARVSHLAGSASVKLSSLRVQPDTTSSAIFARIIVHAEGLGDVRGIARLLASLEQGHELIVVRRLRISSSDVAAAEEIEETLRFEIVAEAISLPRDSNPAEIDR